MKKDVTPEEKLLRLIKSKKASGEKPTEKRKESVNIRKWIALKKPRLKVKVIKEHLIGNLSSLLISLLIGVIIYFLLDTLLITPYIRHKIREIDVKPVPIVETTEETEVTLEGRLKEGVEQPAEVEPSTPYSYYSKDITSRDIFRPLVQEEMKAVEDEFKKIRESLSLIGIISGEELQAAIEDKGNKKTYFVYKGEHIGEVVIEDVLENKVILNYKGETFELML